MSSFSSPLRDLRVASILALALALAACGTDAEDSDGVRDAGRQDGEPGDGADGESADGTDGESTDGADGAHSDGADGTPDGDAGELDAGPIDAGPIDAGELDAGQRDAGEPEPVSECATTIAASENGYVPLCAVDGGVRHVKIAGLMVPAVHASSQVLFGFPSAPSASQPTLGAGQFQALFYGGMGFQPPPMVVANAAGHDVTWTEGADFMFTPSTVCFDLSDGAADRAPAFVLWVSGQKGADCDDTRTLTLASAFAAETSFAGAVGAVSKSAPVFFRQAAAQEAVVTVRNEAVLRVEAIHAADWQRLGTGKHGRDCEDRSTRSATNAGARIGQVVRRSEPTVP